jgi:phage FluMu protein Com
MAQIAMRRVEPSEIPIDGGTALQEDPSRPVFTGNSSDDYLCAACGNVLAASMPPEWMNHKLRIKCGSCKTVNAAIELPGVDYRKAFGGNSPGGSFPSGSAGADPGGPRGG